MRSVIWRVLPHLWALGVGTAVAVQVQASPFGNRPIVDERMYVEWARQIAQGDVLGHDVFFFDPLWAYVLALLLLVGKGSLLFARLFAAALLVGTVELVWRTARELWGSEKLAWFAAACTALYGPLAFATGFLLKEPLTVHGVAWASFLLVSLGRGTARRALALGVTLGLLALLRGNFLLVAAPLLLLLGRRAPVVAAGLALPIALSLGHNVLVGGQWVPTTAHGGANFWLGNHAGASGTYDAPPFIVARPSEELSGFIAEAERRTGRPLTQAQSSRYWLTEGLRFWRDDPLEALALEVRKTRLLLHDYEVPDNYAFTCFRRWFTPALWLAPLTWGLLLGLALAGAVSAAGEPRARVLMLFAALYGASVVVFFVFDRYRVPLAPLLCLFAAYGAVRLSEGRPAALVALAAGLVVAWVPTPISSRQAWHEAQCVGTAGLELEHDGDPAAARWLDEATRLAPEDWPAEAAVRRARGAGR